MDKKTFFVRLPLNAVVSIQVEATSEKQAIEQALDNFDGLLDLTSEQGYDLEEWQVEDKLLQGNVWYGLLYQAEAEEEI